MNISAIIPTFNRRNYIQRAIDSVLAQTLPVDEIIVIDDGSTDGTAEALEACYGSLIRVIRQQNSGVSGARRRGIQEARGEWIAFLDSDDEWTPERNGHLSAATTCIGEDVAWIFGDLCVVTDAGEGRTLFEEYGLAVTECPQVFADSLTVQYPFQFGMLQGSLIRRRVFLELESFSEGLRSDDDFLAGFQIACRYRVAAIPHTVGRYFRTSDLNTSSVVVNGVFGPDYYRARMFAFATAVRSGRRRPWNMYYAEEVRGFCKMLAKKETPPRQLAFEQFRYGGLSAKGFAFVCAAMIGRPGIQAWTAVAEHRRKRAPLKPLEVRIS